MSMRVALVGAGIAGLSCARALVDAGVRVTVFDKGRAPGGRITTRRIEAHAFDLGAQYATAADPRFRGWLEDGVANGAVAEWDARFVAVGADGDSPRGVSPTARFVGVPGMNALPQALAGGLEVRASHRVDRLEREGGDWLLRGTRGDAGSTLAPSGVAASADEAFGRFDVVLGCLPPSQAASLFATSSPLAEAAGGVLLDPCFAVGFAASDEDRDALTAVPFDGAFVGRQGEASDSTLSWVARDSSKPGRPPGERWVLHSRHDVTAARTEAAEQALAETMIRDFARVARVTLRAPALVTRMRWGLARARQPLERAPLWDADARLGLAGDWTADGRVEGAFLAGLDLAASVLALG